MMKWRRLLAGWMAFFYAFCHFGINGFAVAVEVIEEEAFLGTSFEKVVITEGSDEIQSKAFADSSLKHAELPGSLSYIADDAFEGVEGLTVNAPEESYAAEWWAQKQAADGGNNVPTEGLQFGLRNGRWMVCGYSGTDVHVVIPSEYDGNPVTGIYDSAFSQCDLIESVLIPQGITSIGNNAFSGCDALQKVILPSGITEIGESAFDSCTQLNSIVLPNSLSKLGVGAFMRCTSLENIAVPENVSTLPWYLFANCRNLTTVSLPAGLTKIYKGAFYYCSSLTSVSIPQNVTLIGEEAFAYCEELETVILLDRLETIERNAFSDCSKLTKIFIPDSVTSIGSYAFSRCSSLADVRLPAMSTIPSGLFYNCTSLKEVILPDGLTEIRKTDFSTCTNLSKIYIPDSVDYIHSHAFDDCPDVTIYAEEGSYALWYAKWYNFAYEIWQPDVIRLAGSVLTAAGIPIENVNVYVLLKDNETIIATTLTDQNGRWAVNDLSSHQSYSVVFYHENYTFDNPFYDLQEREEPVVGTLCGEQTDASLVFAIQQNGANITSMVVGSEVDFIVDAPDARYVRLIVDGIAYEEYALDENGHAEFSRIFSMVGIREVAFQLLVKEKHEYSVPCASQTLRVTAPDGSLYASTLDIPVIGQVPAAVAGQECSISWSDVEHADSYHVYLYVDDCQCWKGSTQNNHISIPGGVLSEGAYTLLVVAEGYGYNQSEASAVFNVQSTGEELVILNADSIQNSVLGGSALVQVSSRRAELYKKLLIVDPEGIQTETVPTQDDLIYIDYHKTGEYTVRAIASDQKEFSAETALHSTEPVYVAVDANPKINAVTHNGVAGSYGMHYTDDAMQLVVQNTFVADSLALYEGDRLICMGERSRISDYWFHFDCTIPANTFDSGRHELSVKAYFDDEVMASAVAENSYILYMIEPANDDTQYYLAENAELLTASPEKPNAVSVPAGTVVSKKGVYPGLTYVKIGNTFGFVAAELTDQWEAAYTPIDLELCEVYYDNVAAQRIDENVGNSPAWIARAGRSLKMALPSGTDLSQLSLLITFTNTSGEIISVTERAEMLLNSGQPEILIPAETGNGQAGTYRIALGADGKTPDQMLLITVYDPVANPQIMYPSVESAALYPYVYSEQKDVCSVSASETVWWEDSVILVGHYGNEWDCVLYGAENREVLRFVPAQQLHTQKTETTKRGFILISEDFDKELVAPQSVVKKIQTLYTQCNVPVANITSYCPTSWEQWTKTIQTLESNTCQIKYSDITYITIACHGNTEIFAPVTGDADRKETRVAYTDFAEVIKNIPGRVILIMNCCYSGNMCNAAYDAGIDSSKCAIIVSSSEDAQSYRLPLEGPSLINELYKQCRYNSKGQLKADLNLDGKITLNEIATALHTIKTSSAIGNVEYQSIHTFGLTLQTIFEP